MRAFCLLFVLCVTEIFGQQLYFIRHRNKPDDPGKDASKCDKEIFELTQEYLSTPKGWDAAKCLAKDIFVDDGPYVRPTSIIIARPEDKGHWRMIQSVAYFDEDIPLELYGVNDIVTVAQRLNSASPGEILLVCWEHNILVDLVNLVGANDPGFEPLGTGDFDGFNIVESRNPSRTWERDEDGLESCYDFNTVTNVVSGFE